MKNLGSASIEAVQQYLRYAKAAKLSIGCALTAANIPASLINKENASISGEQFQRLIKNLIEQSGDPLLGLKSGRHVQPGSYRALGYITMSCSTLREAINRIVPYEKLVGDMGVTSLTEDNNQIIIQWHGAYSDPIVRRHMIDNVLASWCAYAKWLTNSNQSPIELRLEHDKPTADIVKIYQQTFNCPILFNQQKSGLVISKIQIEKPLRQPDQSLRKTLEQHASTQMLVLNHDNSVLSIKVKNSIRAQLKQGVVRKEITAQQLNLPPRTLQRKLQQESINYQQLLDQVRQELAHDYLKNSPLSFSDIANRLGFSEVRSFHRRCKQWTGQTPGEIREQTTSNLKNP
ncbi:MAG: AraC family transcriptional regulator [Gammaproteobacteria bacterium]|nr:AraC family transcriptional regulator [Gammaproteobacteria bacterium]